MELIHCGIINVTETMRVPLSETLRQTNSKGNSFLFIHNMIPLLIKYLAEIKKNVYLLLFLSNFDEFKMFEIHKIMTLHQIVWKFVPGTEVLSWPESSRCSRVKY